MSHPIIEKLHLDPSAIVRFWQNVEAGDEDVCWPWLGTISAGGYGVFWACGYNSRANRISLFLSVGAPADASMLALHSCDNPSCCNPKHLRWGTAKENTNDFIVRKGGFAGERSPSATITNKDVDAIYQMRMNGFTIGEISQQSGIPYTTVENVYTGRAWSHRLGVSGNPSLEELRKKRPKALPRVSKNRIVTDQMVDHILMRRMSGAKCKDIAKEMNLSLGTVSPVFCGLAFTHRLGVNGNPTFDQLRAARAVPKNVKLSSDDVAEIRDLLGQGAVGRDLAKRYGVSPATITHIKKGEHR